MAQAHPIFPLVYKRGDQRTWEFPCKLTDGTLLDVSGWTITAQIRESPDAASPIDLDINVTDVDGTDCVINVTILEADSTTQTPGDYEWDMEIDRGNGPETVLGGPVTCIADVTHA